MFKHILIATDGSGLVDRAACHCLELAQKLNPRVTAVTATEPWMEPRPIRWAEHSSRGRARPRARRAVARPKK